MLPFQFRINLDAQLARLLGAYDVFVPSSVIRELGRVARRDRKAKGALALAAKYAVYDTTKTGDAGVVAAAEALQAYVVTNDRGLLTVLQARGIPRIRMRSKSHLALEP